MVTIENGIFVVQRPDLGIRQDRNPDTGAPFASEAEAKAWEDHLVASIEATRAAGAVDASAAERERLAAEVHLEVSLSATSVLIGRDVTVSARLVNGLGKVVPVTDSFCVPIEDEAGVARKLKRIDLVNGQSAQTPLTFAQSGYYRLTEAGINRRPWGTYVRLPVPIEIAVYE